MQKPVSGSTTQILMQGVSIAGWFMAFMAVKIERALARRKTETPLECSIAANP
jgi:hypothetical protein